MQLFLEGYEVREASSNKNSCFDLCPGRLGLPGSIKHCRLWYLLLSCAVCCRFSFSIFWCVFFVNVYFTPRPGKFKREHHQSSVLHSSAVWQLSVRISRHPGPLHARGNPVVRSSNYQAVVQQVWFPCQLFRLWKEHLPPRFELSCQVNVTNDLNWSFEKWQRSQSWESSYIWAQILRNANLSFEFSMQPLCDGGETLEPKGFNRNGTPLIHGSNRSHASLQRFSSANLLRFIYWNSTPWRFQDKLDSSPSPLHEKSLGVSKHVHHGFRYLNFVPSPSSCIVGTLDSWKRKWSMFLPVHFHHLDPTRRSAAYLHFVCMLWERSRKHMSQPTLDNSLSYDLAQTGWILGH